MVVSNDEISSSLRRGGGFLGRGGVAAPRFGSWDGLGGVEAPGRRVGVAALVRRFGAAMGWVGLLRLGWVVCDGLLRPGWIFGLE